MNEVMWKNIETGDIALLPEGQVMTNRWERMDNEFDMLPDGDLSDTNRFRSVESLKKNGDRNKVATVNKKEFEFVGMWIEKKVTDE